MYHMKRASVRDLRYRFRRVETLLREGQEIEITKRKRVIAKLRPVQAKSAKLPDFAAQMRKIFGKKKMKVSGAELIARERNRY